MPQFHTYLFTFDRRTWTTSMEVVKGVAPPVNLEIVQDSCTEEFSEKKRFTDGLWSIVSSRLVGVWSKTWPYLISTSPDLIFWWSKILYHEFEVRFVSCLVRSILQNSKRGGQIDARSRESSIVSLPAPPDLNFITKIKFCMFQISQENSYSGVSQVCFLNNSQNHDSERNH